MLVNTVMKFLCEQHNIPYTFCTYYYDISINREGYSDCITSGCMTCPCKRNCLFQKCHDFGLNLPIDSNDKYLVLYRNDLIIQLESYYRFILYGSDGGPSKPEYKYEDLIEFIKNNVDYYKHFCEKWVNDNTYRNKCIVEYNELLDNTNEVFKKIFVFFFPDVKLKCEVFDVLNDQEFIIYGRPMKIKQRHHLDNDLYMCIKNELNLC